MSVFSSFIKIVVGSLTHRWIWGYIVSVLFLCSCSPKQASESARAASDSLLLQDAKGFKVYYRADYKEVIVYNPWEKGKIYARYFLVSDARTPTPENGSKVLVPIRSIASSSVTHIEFLNLLGEINSLTGFCSPSLVYNKEIGKRYREGKITDLGDGFNLNLEKTMQLKPDGVMMSGYKQNDPYSERVTKAGIPLIINVEWMETTLLARAEWIKFVAVFYNKEQLADSIFDAVRKNYELLKDNAADATFHPHIMAGNSFRGTWYMPSGQSFMAKMYADAGADYFYKNDSSAGSLPLNVETVLRNFANCDVWINCNYNSMSELKNADTKHTLFNAFKQHKVYNFNNRLLPSSANDFWESAVAHPDWLLGDVIAILHPELLPNHSFIYAKKLE